MTKGLCALIVLSVLSTNAFSKATCAHSNFEQNLDEITEATALVDNCPKPTKNQFSKLCLKVEGRSFDYETTLKELSCVKNSDGDTTKKEKVQHMWTKHKDEFKCNAEGLNVRDGNVVKMSVASNFMEFLDGLVKDFEIDINFKDPSDGKNVLDYTKDEIERLKRQGGQTSRVRELEGIYSYLQTELNATHSQTYAQ